MPCKITINTVSPPESTDKWLHLSPEGYDIINSYLLYGMKQPGYIEQAGQWITPDLEHERIWVFETRENAEAFLAVRESNEDWQAMKASYTATGVTQTVTLTDI